MHVNYLKLSIANYDLLLATSLTKHDLCRLYKTDFQTLAISKKKHN